jgi:MFS family permease
MVTGTAAAGLVEYEPTGDRSRAALFATLGQTGGGASGPLVAGALAQWAPWPWLLPYVVGAALTAGVAVAVGRMPERARRRGRWRPQWPSIPRAGRTIFVRAGVTAGTAWAAGALFLSVVPTYASVVLGTHNLAVLGAIAALTLGSASVAQAVSLRIGLSADAGQGIGLLFLVAGLGALVGASPTRSAVLLVAGTVLAGAGLGLSYVGAQAQVNQVAPADRRGEVTAAFVTCVYVGLSAGAIGVGLLTDLLSLFAALAIMSALIGAVAMATSLWHLVGREPA